MTSPDPTYGQMSLAWRGDEVVREVDGTAVDAVPVTDARRTRRAYYLVGGAAAVALVVLAVVGQAFWRHRRSVRSTSAGAA